MYSKLEYLVFVGDRGFYLTERRLWAKSDYVQQTNYGPLTAEELLAVLADAPVAPVVEMAQRTLF